MTLLATCVDCSTESTYIDIRYSENLLELELSISICHVSSCSLHAWQLLNHDRALTR